MPPGDVVIHAGDSTWTGTPKETNDFLTWFGGLDYEHKIFIAGNHDKLFQNDRPLALSMIPEGVTYLEDDIAYIDNVCFYGSPWTPRFAHNWAFNLERFDEIGQRWARIPDFTNVLITHGPPHGTLDSVPLYNVGPQGQVFKSAGCEALAHRLRDLSLDLHVFGHIHESPGAIGKSVNAAMIDDDYLSVREPIIFCI